MLDAEFKRRTAILWQSACVASNARRNHRKPPASMKGVITTNRRDATWASRANADEVVTKLPGRPERGRQFPFEMAWNERHGFIAGFKRMRRKWSAPLRTCRRNNSVGAYTQSQELSTAPAVHKPVAAKSCQDLGSVSRLRSRGGGSANLLVHRPQHLASRHQNRVRLWSETEADKQPF